MKKLLLVLAISPTLTFAEPVFNNDVSNDDNDVSVDGGNLNSELNVNNDTQGA